MSCVISYRKTTHIQTYSWDHDSRCQNLYAAPLQGNGKLQKITATCSEASKIIFYCEVALHTLKTKKDKKAVQWYESKAKLFHGKKADVENIA